MNVFTGDKKPVGALSSNYDRAGYRPFASKSAPYLALISEGPRIHLAFPGPKTLSGVARWRFPLRHRAGRHPRN
jgi:hypothetical protein